MMEALIGLIETYHIPVELPSMELMMAGDFIIIIIYAALMGLLAARLKQPTIIAYIITGLILGPAVIGFVEPGELTHTMAELGLAFLLFLIGIEMRVDEVKHILKPLLKISVLLMILISSIGFLTSIGLGFSTSEAIIIGLAVMYSSTAVTIKMLNDKGTATSLHGKIDIGILLFEDIVVVIILTVLAAGQPESVMDVASTLGMVFGLVSMIAIFAAIGSLYFLPPLFRFIANNQKIFFLVSIAWFFLFVLVSHELGMSIEMGAFLAGLAIAQMPYSEELEARVSPLTDLFILVFFVSVGLELDTRALLTYWREALIASVVLMVAKFLIYVILISWQKFDPETVFRGSINMVQVSEFGLIVGSVAVAGGFVDSAILGFLTIIALITMSISVYFIQYNRDLYEFVKPWFDRLTGGAIEKPPTEDLCNHAVIVGFDEIARRVVLLLEDKYDDIVVIDRNIEEDEAIERSGFEAVFGDAKYHKIRKAAGLERADFVFSSSDQREINEMLVEEARDGATVLAEARTEKDAVHLYKRGVDYVVLAPQLAADQLKRYLTAYIKEPVNFEKIVEADLELLRSDALFPTVRPHWSS